MNKIPELLCPAGDLERMQTAILYGADAVYLGAQQFGMRSASPNFSPDQLAAAVRLAHDHHVRVYLTVNTLPRGGEIDVLPAFLHEACACGVDALIVADLGVIAMARRLVPQLELHASTQTGIVNHLTANALYEMGVRRVVLARELTLEEIRTIRRHTPSDLLLEAFVHGAMCMSISGRCVISNYLTGRDANRGECAQPCRWNYHLMEEKRPGVFLPVFEDEHGSTILNARDLCMIEHLGELSEAGISSFKIEGRAKSVYYTGVVTNAYRVALDAAAAGAPVPRWAVAELDTVSHREYSTGFYYGAEPVMQSYHPGGYIQHWEISAVAEGWENGRLLLTERNRFADGDQLELLEPGLPPCPVLVQDLQDQNGAPLDAARHPLMPISIHFDRPVRPGSLLRRKR